MENELILPIDKPSIITKWFVRKGSVVRQGTMLCTYTTEGSSDVQKLKSTQFGTVVEILAFIDSVVKPRESVLKIKGCTHPVVMKDMCAECGEDLREKFGVAGDRKGQSSASVAMVHSIPELIISTEQAVELGKADEQRLLNTRKLVLLVDLDETLLHTTNDNVPPNLKDVYHFQLQHGPSKMWYHSKFRPGTHEFLEKMSKLYELHICTFGARMYAHTMASYLDPNKKYFSHRILSRDECFDPRSKQANLRALFPCGDGMVCIIDDREEVWKFTPNMIKVKPYHFFQHTADINAPPGMERTDADTDKTPKRSVKVHRIRKKEKETPEEKSKESDKENEKKEAPDKQSKESDKENDISDAKCGSENGKDNTAIDAVVSGDIVMTSEDEKEKQNENKENPEKNVETKSGDMTEDSKSVSENSLETETRGEEAKNMQSTDTVECVNEFIGQDMEVSSDSEDEEKSNSEKQTETEKQKENEKCEDENSKETSKTETKIDSPKSNEAKNESKNDEAADDFEEIIEWEDTDDYLFYLEEILTQVHKIFFDMHDELKQKYSDIKEEDKPNLKKIIPYAKQKVLQGKNIVFSGVVPTNMLLERSRPYVIAKSLGAHVQTDLVVKGDKSTTHVVAARMGTVKVKEALKNKGIAVVRPEWLYLCDWRWELVDERLFLLDESSAYTPENSQAKQGLSLKRKTPEELDNDTENNDASSSKRQKSNIEPEVTEENVPSTSLGAKGDSVNAQTVGTRRFSDSFSQLAHLSQEDLDSLSREVEEMSDDSGSEEGAGDRQKERTNEEADEFENGDEDLGSDDATLRQQVLGISSPETSSDESMSGDYPQGWRPKSKSPTQEDNSHLLEIDDPHEAKTALFKAARSSDHFLFEEESNSVTENSEDSQDSGDDELAAAVERGLFS